MWREAGGLSNGLSERLKQRSRRDDAELHQGEVDLGLLLCWCPISKARLLKTQVRTGDFPLLVLEVDLAYRPLLLGVELQLRGLLLELRDGRLLVQVDVTGHFAAGPQRSGGGLLLLEAELPLADRTAGLLNRELGELATQSRALAAYLALLALHLT